MKKITKYIACLIVFASFSATSMAQDYIYEVIDGTYKQEVKLRNSITNETVDGVAWHPFNSKKDVDPGNNIVIEPGDLYALDETGRFLMPLDTFNTPLVLNRATDAIYISPEIVSQTHSSISCEQIVTVTGCPNGQQSVWYQFPVQTWIGDDYPVEIVQRGGTTLVLKTEFHLNRADYYVACENNEGWSKFSTMFRFQQTNYSGGGVPAKYAMNDFALANGQSQVATICKGQGVILSARWNCFGNIPQWYADETTYMPLTSLTVTPTVTTIYYLRCYNTTSSCMGSPVGVKVIVDEVSTIPDVSSTVINCLGSETQLTGVCNYGELKWYSDSALTSELVSSRISPSTNTTYYAACVSGTCKSNAASTTVTVTPGLSLTATSFSKTNTQNIYKTDGRISISGLASNTAYRVSYNFKDVPQSPVSYNANASGMLNITGFTPGSYSSFNVSNPSGCSSGVVSSTQVID